MGNTHFQRDFEVHEKLGSGTFAIVKRVVRKKDGKEFAVKIIKKKNLDAKDLENIHEEVKIMADVDHPNVVKLERPVYDEKKLLTGGELFERIVKKHKYSEKEAADVIKEIAKALKYLHKKGIVHRDLKPENLLYVSPLEDSAIKITDFGLAKYTGGQEQFRLKTACGTPGYVAPEILKGIKYGPEVDLWSLGVILYILLCGFPPFYDDSAAKLYHKIKEGLYDFPDEGWANVSKEAIDLVKKMLTVDPRKRCTIDDLLKHPWITGKAKEENMGPKFMNRLTRFNARNKMMRAINTIRAVNRFARALEDES